MSLQTFAVGDEVAIMPSLDSPPTSVIQIAKVVRVDSHTLQIEDLRMFSLQYRWGLTPRAIGYVVHAIDEHREALRERCSDG